MLIYIGDDLIVQQRDIVAILDKDVFVTSAENLTSLSLSTNIDLKNVKSIVVTTHDIYYSPFASQTLKKRLYTFMR
ncbi:extracellular matrix regulator RemB [Bacillus songklensis]|uniref:Extracellular matrix regulator RemB n=1 Tax=Bacillus songklensis TaxID=1069116 RepID=A0ABV8B7Q4_9BACI